MTNSLQAYYAARVDEYDQVYLKPERQGDLRAMECWLPGQLSGLRILEIACGTGYWTQFIGTVAERVVAIDLVAETLKIARNRVANPRVKFLIADAYRIPYDVGSFNGAFAGFWFSHIPRSQQREFLLQLNRLLEPGSRVVLLDNLYVEGSSTPVAERDNEGNTYQFRALADGSSHRVLKNFPTEQELCRLVADIGHDARFTRWQHYWGFDYVTRSP